MPTPLTEMTYEEALTQARSEYLAAGSFERRHSLERGDPYDVRQRAREIHDAARRAEDRRAYAETLRERQAWLNSHSDEWHAHQRAIEGMGMNARCEPGCMCEVEPW